ncbi:MAG: 4-phosphopantetheinyl transferase [Duganella sp.]
MTATARILMADACAVTDAGLDRLRDWLSASELARGQRLVRAGRLRQFVVGRALARTALGRSMGVPARAVVLAERIAGAPLLVAPARRAMPWFSIAHSGRWVACAVSAETALGLDIELRDGSRDLAALAAQAFVGHALAQWGQLHALPHAQRVDGFYRLWCEQEAQYKLGGDGQGINVGVAHAELSIVLCSERALDAPPAIDIVTFG